jgi:hypothetical protein
MMYGKQGPAYKKETNKKKKKAMSNPNKDSGTMSCSSKGIRTYK